MLECTETGERERGEEITLTVWIYIVVFCHGHIWTRYLAIHIQIAFWSVYMGNSEWTHPWVYCMYMGIIVSTCTCICMSQGRVNKNLKCIEKVTRMKKRRRGYYMVAYAACHFQVSVFYLRSEQSPACQLR